MAIWMDSLLTKVPNVAALDISLPYNSKCKIFLDLLMKIFHSLNIRCITNLETRLVVGFFELGSR
jgi:hypothetical protein